MLHIHGTEMKYNLFYYILIVILSICNKKIYLFTVAFILIICGVAIYLKKINCFKCLLWHVNLGQISYINLD